MFPIFCRKRREEDPDRTPVQIPLHVPSPIPNYRDEKEERIHEVTTTIVCPAYEGEGESD